MHSFLIKDATGMLIFRNVNSNTNHFDTDIFIAMLFRAIDFFVLETSFSMNRLTVSN